MKHLLLIITTILTLSNWGLLMAQNQEHESSNQEGIQFFKGSWDDALALANKEDKLIFLDVYASWCGPCKVLKAKTFPNREVGQYFNDNFINVTLDGEKGDGIQVAQQLKVSAYPSLFMLNTDGEPIVYYAGYLQPGQLIELGKAGLDHKK